MRLEPDFNQDFLQEMIFLGACVRKPNAKQNGFQIVKIFFPFFFSIFLRHYVAYVSAGFGEVLLALILGCYGRIQRGDGGPDPLLLPPPPPPEKSQKFRVSKQYWSRSPENHKATKPAFNVGPVSTRQRKAI